MSTLGRPEVAAPPPRLADTAPLPAAAPALAVRSFGLTDRGKVRPTNQDQFLIARLIKALQVQGTSLPQPKVQQSSDQSHLLVVADGIGGGTGGEQASALAIGSVESFVVETFKWFGEGKGRDHEGVLSAFQSALAHANERVLAAAGRRPDLHDMGTTLTLAYSLNRTLFVAHVGDSRCYLFRGGTLHRVTSDHTLVEELVRRGYIGPEEAARHHWRHVITNAIGGGSPEVKVDVHQLYLEADDGVLVCSDGLTEMVPEPEIAATLRAEPDPERACRRLVARANEAGGRDNITVVVARYEAAPSPA
jgi:serine/threonine protein phosphatase PrpC